MNSKLPSKTFLLLADISGYTHFMLESPVASAHARQIIIRLLKSLVNVPASPLKVAELEGDAVFFYATAAQDDVERIDARVKEHMMKLFAAFTFEAGRLAQMNACECDACANVGQLRLKQILHVGDVVIERVKQFTKLFGVDVILVHKLLKNSIPFNEYVLMTEQAYAVSEGFHGLTPRTLRESVEEFGTVNVVVFYPVLFPYVPAAGITRYGTRLTALLWSLHLKLSTLLDRVRKFGTRSLLIRLLVMGER